MFLGLTSSELFVIGFITLAVVSAPWWPKLGAAVAVLLAGRDNPGHEAPDQDRNGK